MEPERGIITVSVSVGASRLDAMVTLVIRVENITHTDLIMLMAMVMVTVIAQVTTETEIILEVSLEKMTDQVVMEIGRKASASDSPLGKHLPSHAVS